MKKLLFVALAVLMLAACITGCGEKDSSIDTAIEEIQNAIKTKQMSIHKAIGEDILVAEFELKSEYETETFSELQIINVINDDISKEVQIYIDTLPEIGESSGDVVEQYKDFEVAKSKAEWKCIKISYEEAPKPTYLIYSETNFEDETYALIVSGTNLDMVEEIASAIEFDRWVEMQKAE